MPGESRAADGPPVLRGLREHARGKLQHLLEQVLDAQRAELDAAAERRSAELRAELSARLVELEVRTRRDLHFAAEVDAATSSARFAAEHMPTVPTFDHPHATLRHAAALVEGPGMVMELGVASGTTLRLLTEALPGRLVAGFDVFTGLPEDWRTGFPAGAFAQDALPEVPGALLVAGLFADTLPPFLAAHPEPLALLHLDADLYSSTVTVLDLVGDRVRPGTVVLCDEYFNFPGWPDGEHRAWAEFCERTGTRFRFEGYTYNHEQVVLTVQG